MCGELKNVFPGGNEIALMLFRSWLEEDYMFYWKHHQNWKVYLYLHM